MLSMQGVEHLETEPQALAELQRMLRSGEATVAESGAVLAGQAAGVVAMERFVEKVLEKAACLKKEAVPVLREAVQYSLWDAQAVRKVMSIQEEFPVLVSPPQVEPLGPCHQLPHRSPWP